MRIGLTVLATVAGAIALPATAHADSEQFLSQGDYTHQPPPPPLCAEHVSWGNRFMLEQGRASVLSCHGDTLRVPGEPTLDYGHTKFAGTFTCDNELSGVKCTDSSTGHYFRVS